MKKGWPKEKLNELCTLFADGDWIESKDQSSAGIRLIQTGNVGEGIFKDREHKARYISESTFKKLRCTEIFEGDCLVSRLPDPVGRSCVLPDTGIKMITAVDCTIIRFDPAKITSKYFNYYSQSKKYYNDIDKEITGTTRNRISRSKLGEVEIPLPPLPEQKRIVAVLDELLATLAKAKENVEINLANARELFESVLQEVLSNSKKNWEEKKLGEMCKFSNGQAHEQHIKVDGRYIVVNSKFISSEGEKYKRTNKTLSPLSKNDIVMVMSDVPNGKALAKCYLIEKDDTYTLNQRICSIRSDKFEVKFLYYLINRNKYLLGFNNGENQTNLRKNDILNCPLLVPARNEQKEIISKLEILSAETRKLEFIYQKKLSDLEELKKSILQIAFAGDMKAQLKQIAEQV